MISSALDSELLPNTLKQSKSSGQLIPHGPNKQAKKMQKVLRSYAPELVDSHNNIKYNNAYANK